MSSFAELASDTEPTKLPAPRRYVHRDLSSDDQAFAMGYLDGWWGRKSDDPLQDLDPKAREFLKRESPVKYESSSKQPTGQDQDGATSNTSTAVAAAAATTTQSPKTQTASNPDPAASGVPSESLYQDGRYAHLWRTYRPLSEVENETKTDTEKLQDVLEAFKARKAAIGTAALENCAEEQLDWSSCMREGSLRARMTMCSEEVRKFERCFNMQSVSSVFHSFFVRSNELEDVFC